MTHFAFNDQISADDIPARISAIDAELAALYRYADTAQALLAEKSWLEKRLQEVRSVEQTIILPGQPLPVGTRSPIR